VLGHYLLFPAIAALAGAAMAAVGALISVSSRSAVHAQGLAMLTWFGFVLLYDLVLMGSLAVSGMPAQWLAAALVGNPVDAARVLGVLALEPDLYLLGPAGSFLTTRLSAAGTAGVLLGALGLWAAMPVSFAAMKFSIRRRSFSYVEGQVRSVAVGRRTGGSDRVHVQRGVAEG
jgi:Cu-processing system permease protein